MVHDTTKTATRLSEAAPADSSFPFSPSPTSSVESSNTTKKARKPRIVLEGSAEEIVRRNNTAAGRTFVEGLIQRAGTNWNRFYTNHAAAGPFFKDRHWLDREWEELKELGRAEDGAGDGDGRTDLTRDTMLEVGCGTGATIYPLLERYPRARFVAFDFAKKAVELTKRHAKYNPAHTHIFQHDLTKPLDDLYAKLDDVPPEFGPAVRQFDIVSCVFVLSAIAPRFQAKAMETLLALLAPGGSLLFRDYALHDAAQLRFHSLPSASYASNPSLLSPQSDAPVSDSSSQSDSTFDDFNRPFYRRGDNTLTYFFTAAEIQSYVDEARRALEIEVEGKCEVVEREMENRKEQWGCTRRFVHGSWRRVM
ncbi:methyltransferase [Rhodotorula toruloides]|uniref:tRNA N(3)-methylcytidine methyltransferase n=1 Tax=Rhodotorula toruloides TaxID=5286 RepID=A0A511KR79_RHOTO|nr:methyltransferase [Rhodotorula toruloides]